MVWFPVPRHRASNIVVANADALLENPKRCVSEQCTSPSHKFLACISNCYFASAWLSTLRRCLNNFTYSLTK